MDLDAQAVDTGTPERLFEQQWAITLLGRVLDKLAEEMAAKGKAEQFEQLSAFLSGPKPTEAYAAAAEALGISQGAVKVAAHRLRARYRHLLRGEIAQTVASPDEIDDEIQNLFAVLGSGKAEKIL
jgi:RNA polymerase sigma-70 factor (ECF subfamily)